MANKVIPSSPSDLGRTDAAYAAQAGRQWAMHHAGRIFNPVSAFGYSIAAIQALEARLAVVEDER